MRTEEQQVWCIMFFKQHLIQLHFAMKSFLLTVRKACTIFSTNTHCKPKCVCHDQSICGTDILQMSFQLSPITTKRDNAKNVLRSLTKFNNKNVAVIRYSDVCQKGKQIIISLHLLCILWTQQQYLVNKSISMVYLEQVSINGINCHFTFYEL